MKNEKQWYAVYTKPRWEKKVSSSLSKKNIDNYCPLNKIKRKWSDRYKIVNEPLITSYVFVNIGINEKLVTKETNGVLNFVNWLGKPAVIRKEEIEVIRRFLNDYVHVTAAPLGLNVYDRIRILNGPLMMEEGEVLEVRKKTVRVILPSLGYSLTAEIDKNNLEKLND